MVGETGTDPAGVGAEKDEMNKTTIEWCDYTVNPVKGLCPVSCLYCYARRMYKRFHWDETIRFTNDLWNEAPKIKRPSRIFVGSTMELFGPWIDPEWMRLTLNAVKAHPQHTFIFLTKRPWELPKFNPWPGNCWVGASVTVAEQQSRAYLGLSQADAMVKFISYEPLLTNVYMEPQFLRDAGINWLIIGQKTPVQKDIPRGWVNSITNAAEHAHIPVFMKNNLLTAIGTNYEGEYMRVLRQEWPQS